METHISEELRRFNRLLGEVDGAYHDAALRLKLSDSGLKVLYVICCDGGCCPLREVVRRSGMSKQTVNSAIRKLEGEGAVCLEPAGARGKTVCLTRKGRALAERTAIPLMGLESEIFSAWSKDEVETYLELTQRFLAAFREKIERL